MRSCAPGRVADNIEIRAPVAGFVLARNISLGERFERGTELYRIADLSRVWILADIFESEAQYLPPGNKSAGISLPHQRKDFPGHGQRCPARSSIRPRAR